MNGTWIRSLRSISFQVWQDGVASGGIRQICPRTPLAAFEAGYTMSISAGTAGALSSLSGAAVDRWLIVAQRADMRFALAEKVHTRIRVAHTYGAASRGFADLADCRPRLPTAAVIWQPRWQTSAADDLSAVAGNEPPQELEVLVESINDLLRRLESSLRSREAFCC